MTAMILISVVMSSGCSSYKRFTLREGDAHFSFEYPGNYEEVLTHVYSGWAAVSFDHELVEEDWIIESSYLRVDVYEAGRRGNPDAEAALESAITRIATEEYYSDFEILERSSVSIAGVKGEQCTLSYCYREEIPATDDEGPFLKLPALMTVRCVYFDYNGFIWEIWLRSTEGFAEEDKAHFEHIIETFEILD